MLGLLDEADEEAIELRLLSDSAFGEEFDIVVDEIAIRYASGGYDGEEKDRVERYFLRAPERQNKVKMMCELLHHSATTRGEQPAMNETQAAMEDSGSVSWFRRIWNQPLVPRLAVAAAAVVIVAAIFFWTPSGGPATSNYATLVLTNTDAERDPQNVGNEVKSIKFAPDIHELHLELLLPSPQTQAKTYRAELIPTTTSLRPEILTHNATTVVVAVPAPDLKPDRYGIRLFAINPDGSEERIPGSYVFRVE